MFCNDFSEVGRILRLGGPKKNFPGRGFFPQNFFKFVDRNPWISGYFGPRKNLKGQSGGIQGLFATCTTIVEGRGRGAMAPHWPPSNYLTAVLIWESKIMENYLLELVNVDDSLTSHCVDKKHQCELCDKLFDSYRCLKEQIISQSLA